MTNLLTDADIKEFNEQCIAEDCARLFALYEKHGEAWLINYLHRPAARVTVEEVEAFLAHKPLTCSDIAVAADGVIHAAMKGR